MPAKTPRDIIDKFHDAGTRLLAEPSMQQSLTKLGVEPLPMTPAEMDAFVAREIAENLEVIKAAGDQTLRASNLKTVAFTEARSTHSTFDDRHRSEL